MSRLTTPVCPPRAASLCHVMMLPAAAVLPGRPARWRRRASRAAKRCSCSGASAAGGYYDLREDDFLLSQASGVTDTLFKGDVLGVDADVASTDFRSALTTLHWLDADAYHLPPRLADAVAVHVAKCYLGVSGAPLVLGVWGPKGSGKTLGVQLACKALGVTPFLLQAADLEDSLAGEPGLRLRSRYAAAVACAATTGTLTALVVDDLDTGIGRYKHTGRTINAQTVAASLMALCDAPSSQRRVPVLITAADVSRLYAPLLRDGRMAKLLWQPSPQEMVAIIQRLFAYSTTGDAAAVQAAFPGRGPDFYGAILSRLWDASLAEWMDRHGGPTGCGAALVAALADDGQPADTPRQPGLSVADVVAAGQALEAEAEWFASLKLSRQYLRWSEEEGAPRRTREHDAEAAAQASVAAQKAQKALALAQQQAAAAADAMFADARATAAQKAEQQAEQQAEATPPAPPVAAPRWAQLSAVDVKRMMDAGTANLVDIRSAKENDKSTVKGAVSVPSFLQKGSSLAPELAPLGHSGAFAAALAKKVPLAAGVTRVLMGPDPGGPGEALAVTALGELADAGVEGWAELAGGHAGWSAKFTPTGVPRQTGAYPRTEFDFWTASN